MKITSVDIFEVKINMEGTGNCVGSVPWTPICVRINTDEGVSGYGEVGLCYGMAQKAAVGILRDYAPFLIGENPLRIEHIWNKLYKQSFWGQGGGSVVFGGISAVDVALWDIKGKALNAPVHQLLGGKTNSTLRCYASQIQFDWGMTNTPMITPQDYYNAAKKALAEGYDAVKVDPIGYDLDGNWHTWQTEGYLPHKQFSTAVERVAAIRDALGDGPDIIIEHHCFSDTTAAIQLGLAYEKYRIMMFEEPVTHLNPKLTRQLKEKLNIPIAAGERIYTRWGYRPYFEDRSLDMIQPDIGTVGGLTEAKKVCDYAQLYDVKVQAHVCGGPIATAAALQLEAAVPNFHIHELHVSALLEYNIRMGTHDYKPKNGVMTVPDLPGIGQELSEEALRDSVCITVR